MPVHIVSKCEIIFTNSEKTVSGFEKTPFLKEIDGMMASQRTQ